MQVREYIIEQGGDYWHKNSDKILDLPIPHRPPQDIFSSKTIPPSMEMIVLPDWADDLGISARLLVPKDSIINDQKTVWQNVDWYSAAFWFIAGIAEVEFEKKYGPIHSYSFRLKNWDNRIWKHAWVNRIFLFLRRWAAREAGNDEEMLFGSLPKAEIILTHDVDAVEKTFPIRIKQTAFYGLNFVRNIIQGRFTEAGLSMCKAFRFFFTQDNYWCFDQIQNLEKRNNRNSIFNFYGGRKGRNFKSWIMNPGYDVKDDRIASKLSGLCSDGWQIGLHQGFDTWADADKMKIEKQSLEESLGKKIEYCRQHWLRFSWEKTWQAQEDAGFKTDTTLAFNDRPGFRSATALLYNPWNHVNNTGYSIKALPTVFMDSHFYDYQSMPDKERKEKMSDWINEIRAVHGKAAVIWHQRVFSRDYGWGDGYKHLLEMIS